MQPNAGRDEDEPEIDMGTWAGPYTSACQTSTDPDYWAYNTIYWHLISLLIGYLIWHVVRIYLLIRVYLNKDALYKFTHNLLAIDF